MSDLINPTRFRKEKERRAKAKQAAENRAAHGRSKADKALVKARAEKFSKALDQHRRTDDET